MKAQEKNSQENVKTVSDNKESNSVLVASTNDLITKRKRMTYKKRIKRNKIVQFDRNSVVSFVDDLQLAVNHICAKYGTKNVEVENVKFVENDLQIDGLHVRLSEPLPIKNEITIIDATSKAIKKVKNKIKDTAEEVKEAVKTVGEYIGREFKQGYRTFKILGHEGDKFSAITRRNKKFILSSEDLDKMKLVA